MTAKEKDVGKVIGTAVAIVFAAMIGGCNTSAPEPFLIRDPDLQPIPGDAKSRAFSGKLLSLDTMRGRIRIVIDDQVPPGNIICRYDRDTQFFLDGQRTTLDKLMEAFTPYMPVRAKGHVETEFFKIDIMKVSSAVPLNAPQTQPATQAK